MLKFVNMCFNNAKLLIFYSLDYIKLLIYTFIMELKYIKKENDNYITINDILNLELCISSRLRLKLIKSEKIFLNGKPCDTRNSLNIGDIITINLDFEEDNSNIMPFDMKLDIIYEDDWLLIINKPAGIAIHPSILHYNNSISNGVKFYFDLNRYKKEN